MTNSNLQEPFGPGPTGLYRDPKNGKIAGVCAGLAAYFGVKVGGLRVALILLSVFGFFGPVVVAYIVLAVLLHPKPAHLFKDSDDEAFWRSVVRRPADTVSGLSRRFRELDQRMAKLERQVTSPDEVLRAQFRQL
ncbi:MAG TPA: envelope stress response membrane protein PspC [Alphaproteobacteria bacterium]|jgi:phage shock protein C|nr:envelope stress response membrane protein PspC [Alphaproteobacteria bacterium]